MKSWEERLKKVVREGRLVGCDEGCGQAEMVVKTRAALGCRKSSACAMGF
jgi:hypothetical protein